MKWSAVILSGLLVVVAGCNQSSLGGSSGASPDSKATAGSTMAPAPAPATGAAASSPAPAATAASDLPALTVHLAGDSTVSNYPATTKQEGWGMELGQFFTDKVTIDNKAVGGANVQSFKSGSWPRLIAAVKPGDYVMSQFGANDSGTAHGPVTPADFAQTLEQMADEVKARGGTMIFVTPSAFYQWGAAGKEDNARLAPYAAACYDAAKARQLLVDDLNARGVEWLNTLGQAEAKSYYLPNSQGVPDKAHFVKSGAVKMASMVAEELKRIHSPLAAYLK